MRHDVGKCSYTPCTSRYVTSQSLLIGVMRYGLKWPRRISALTRLARRKILVCQIVFYLCAQCIVSNGSEVCFFFFFVVPLEKVYGYHHRQKPATLLDVIVIITIIILILLMGLIFFRSTIQEDLWLS